jgi:hypothetical protein
MKSENRGINFHDKRSEFRQVDWPLGSKKNYFSELAQYFTKKSHNQRHDILVHGKKITLTVEKGTKRITHFLNPSLPVEENTKHQSSKSQVCSTCKVEITDISRVLIMRDKDGGPRLLCYHFFYPCWDMELLCQQYSNLVIDKVGFSIPENMSLKQRSLEDLQRNHEFWI